MKKSLLILAISLFISYISKAQDADVYLSSGGEVIFSWAVIDYNGNDNGNVMRFSPVFNLQNILNVDINPVMGFFTGLNAHNIGFIYDIPGTDTRMKFRNYTLGIPAGIKIGKMDKSFIFGGYEVEFPINYKEKRFENEKKVDKFDVWFSKRVPGYYHTVFGGFQLAGGTAIKIKYYLTGFHNENYSETINGIPNKPYKGLKTNLFYVSLSFDVFKKDKFVSIKTDENRVY